LATKVLVVITVEHNRKLRNLRRSDGFQQPSDIWLISGGCQITTGKCYFTLGKGFAECNTRQRFHRQRVLCRVLFSDTRQRLCRVSKNTRQKKHSKLRIEKILKKTAKHILNSRNNSPTLPYYLTRCPIIFHYYFESNLYVL
jgi:hypothetical protein